MSNAKGNSENLPIGESEQKERIIQEWVSYRNSMEAEIQSEIEKTKESFFTKRLRYLKTKHPLLSQKVVLEDMQGDDMRDYWFPSVSRKDFRKLEFDIFCVLEYYKQISHRHILLYRGRYALESLNKINLQIEQAEAAMDPSCKQLALEYIEDAVELARSQSSVAWRYKDLNREYRQEIIQSLVDRYWEQHGTPELKYQVGYILAKRGDYDRYLPTPIRKICFDNIFVGPNWKNGGFGFRIEKNCFANENPQLYYCDSDGWPGETERLEKSLALSSGIGDAHIEKKIIANGISPYERTFVVFRLDKNTIRKTFPRFGVDVPIEKVGSYIFMRCYGSRDFKYQFGEIVNGEMIPLYCGSI